MTRYASIRSRMTRYTAIRLAAALASVVVVGAAAPAVAHRSADKARQPVHKPRRPAHNFRKATKAVAIPRGMTVGVGNTRNCITTGANPVPTIRRYKVRSFHEVLPPYADPTVAAQCFAAAVRAGYRVSVAIQYNNWWSTSQDIAWFKAVMPVIAPYVWEVSIGNEQELWTGGDPQPPRLYAKTWRAVEPIVRRYAPYAMVGAGEISPWGEPFLKAAWRYGLPGVQVIAAHPYRKPGSFTVPELLRWARQVGKPVWFTEGVLLPGGRAWGVSVPPTRLAGAAYAFSWLCSSDCGPPCSIARVSSCR
jgi:hypothetical protein